MKSLVLLVTCVVLTHGRVLSNNDYDLNIQMKDAVADKPDDLVCTGKKLDPEESYILKFTPHASKTTVHHMVVYGCKLPAVTDYETPWKCFDVDANSDNSLCGENERQILFAWALDAPEKSLPEGVGFRVSGDTGLNYIVTQLHYAKMFPEGVTDNSGITLHISKTRPAQQAGYIVLGNYGNIPPQLPAYHMESACDYSRDYPIYPIGYRTHSHNLGMVTSGYRIRDGKWTEIGRMSPQLPQTFYNISHPDMVIKPGDVLTSRCTMNSLSRQHTTIMGPKNRDEMCNFYIMYSTYQQGELPNEMCFQDSSSWSWSQYFDKNNIPKSASSLDGIPGAKEAVEHKFNIQV